MQKIQRLSIINLAACAAVALGFALPAQAQGEKVDPSGTWTWTMPGRGGGEPRKVTLILKVEEGKLTGKVSTPGRQEGQVREAAIENGKIQGDEISFTVTREFGNNKVVQKYTGKLSGDTIKGKIEFERNGEPVSRDWEAKREKSQK